MFSKVDVNGDQQCALYKFLTDEKTNPDSPGPIKWNFEKFVIDRSGKVVARFASKVKPDSKELTSVVEAALKQK
jgi:glutathione peroxidase